MPTHLHNHCEVSHDGFGSPYELVQKAKELNIAVALTDHGVVTGLVDMYKAGQELETPVILGCEVYYQHEVEVDTEQPRYHLTVLCASNTGYSNLMHMVSEANHHKHRTMPIVSWESLQKYQEGLIILSGCVSSYLSYLIQEDNELEARIWVREMQAIFGERFFLEVQPFPAPNQVGLNAFCTTVGREYGITVVMTADAHYPDKSLFESYSQVQKMRKGDRAVGTAMADYSQRYLHTTEEMCEAFQSLMGYSGQEYWENTDKVLALCNVTLESEPNMPQLTWLKVDPFAFLKKKVETGLREKGLTTQTYIDRAIYELKTIRDKNYVTYFLMVWDIFQFCIAHNIPATTRGSAGGSLVNYALGLSTIDPIKHNTSFERFLSPDRADLPDVDIDVSAKRRQEVVDYVMARYSGNVFLISTKLTWKGYSLINSLAKTYGLDAMQVRMLKDGCREVGVDEIPFTADTLYNNINFASIEGEHPGFIRKFTQIYGGMSFIGTHPAGMAVSGGDIKDKAAVVVFKGKEQLCYACDALDLLGIVKLDILGVNGMDIVQEAQIIALQLETRKLQARGVSAEQAKKQAALAVYPQNYLDEDVLKIFRKGDTAGIHQYEKLHVQWYLRSMNSHTKEFRHLAAVNALIRPACKLEGTDKLYLKRLKGEEKPEGIWLQFAADTEGTLLYQEQVVDICRYAGLDWSDISKVLKAIKRGVRTSVDLANKFLAGMIAKGHKKLEAADIWVNMHRYLFNRAHAMAYTDLAVREAYYKAHYPVAWYIALVNNENNDAKRRLYYADATQHGQIVMLAHVNGGENAHLVTVNGQDYIQLGLLHLPGVGPQAADAIVTERIANGSYNDAKDFVDRINRREMTTVGGVSKNVRVYPSVNVAVLSALQTFGALEFNPEDYQGRMYNFNKDLLATPVMIK